MLKQVDSKQLKKETTPVIKGQDSSVSIKMNPFDRMTLVSFDQLPQTAEKRLAFYAMISPVLESYGGKKLISLPEQYLKEAVDSECFKLHLKFLWTIRAEDLLANMVLIEKKLKEKELPKCRLVSDQKEYKNRGGDLFNFKKDNAAFITAKKIEDGLYGEVQELDKAKRGVQCTLQDDKGNILASLLVFQHKSLAYVADFIVEESLRNKGLGELICLSAFKALFKAHPEIQNVGYIAGGAGAEDWCKTFYTKTLSSKQHDDARKVIAAEEAQKGVTKMGVFASFGAPGKMMLDECASILPPKAALGK